MSRNPYLLEETRRPKSMMNNVNITYLLMPEFINTTNARYCLEALSLGIHRKKLDFMIIQ